MPPSQLKRLKTSLRERGITGPQKSKKQKKAQQNGKSADRAQRNVALQQIRDSFNPFEFQANARPEKFSSFSTKPNRPNGSSDGFDRQVRRRPGVSKSLGEEMRRETLLQEVRRRNKVGGLVDRRIGEGDTSLTPEERAVQRFAQENRKKRKGANLFNLEDDDEELHQEASLTHLGQRLDDYDISEDRVHDQDAQTTEEEDDEALPRKRRRSDTASDHELEANEGQAENDQPQRKRSKKEILEEVIAKSKLYKYERQKAKEDDEDLREELDKGTGELLGLLRDTSRNKPPANPREPETPRHGAAMNPDRQRMIDGLDRNSTDKDYDVRLRQLAEDARAKPSERTKTAEEKAAEEAEKLRDLEEKRLKRMRGEKDVDEDDEYPPEVDDTKQLDDEDDTVDEAAEFGFVNATTSQKKQQQLVLEDEDEFILDEDLIASGSDIDLSEAESTSSNDSGSERGADIENEETPNEEDEFVRGILGDDIVAASTAARVNGIHTSANEPEYAYTYPCPRTHEQLVDIVKAIPTDRLTIVIQRIRALHHPSLSATNKEAMGDFSRALVDHVAYMGDAKQALAPTEQVMRHLHSLSRTYPSEIGDQFRIHLLSLHKRGNPTPGDLMILTAIGSIYPTSDQWHQVATPASTLMARWLALNAPVKGTPPDSKSLATGVCLVALMIKYQTLSKRYIPEALRFTLRVLGAKSISASAQAPHLANLLAMAELWKDKSAFTEIISPAMAVLQPLCSSRSSSSSDRSAAQKAVRTLQILVQQARLRRRPLELHHHRPRAIRTAVPKFEEAFHPDKHYDPDAARSDAKRFQKEYKRERKGAIRDLRKDTHFLAREQLREKRARDAEYEKKYRRLVAEVQAEEGHERKEYEREKRLRTRKQKSR